MSLFQIIFSLSLLITLNIPLTAEACSCFDDDFEIYKPTYGILQFGTIDRNNNSDSTTVKFQVNFTKNVTKGELLAIPMELEFAYTLKALWNIEVAPVVWTGWRHK